MAVILKDLNGNVIGEEPSQPYVATRRLRNRVEQALCDKQMGIDREALRREQRAFRSNHARVTRGLEPIYDNEGARHCSCEDYPCCGH
jgi:hypothetical protein